MTKERMLHYTDKISLERSEELLVLQGGLTLFALENKKKQFNTCAFKR